MTTINIEHHYNLARGEHVVAAIIPKRIASELTGDLGKLPKRVTAKIVQALAQRAIEIHGERILQEAINPELISQAIAAEIARKLDPFRAFSCESGGGI